MNSGFQVRALPGAKQVLEPIRRQMNMKNPARIYQRCPRKIEYYLLGFAETTG
jgi:hypothetical protein